MHQFAWPRRSWAPAILVALAIAGCGAAGVLLRPSPAAQQRLAAQQRWAARPFANYRLAIQVDFGGSMCSQELESQGESIRRIMFNNCRPNWMGLTTVARLFEIGERLERPEPCYSLTQVCLCTRVGQGDIAYDTRLGFPQEIVYRREIRPNFLNSDYWRRLIFYHQLPSCGPLNQTVRIAVTTLLPIQ